MQGTGTEHDGKIYTVTDRGGLVIIKNGRYIFDLWMPAEAQCRRFGRRNGTVKIVNQPESTHSSGGASFGSVDSYSSGGASFEANTSSKKKTASDLIDIAVKELGYRETGENRTKYGQWYGMDGAMWCHMFVSWCASRAKVLGSLVPKTASTTTGMQWFLSKGHFRYKGKYTPKRNDIIYFKSDGASHVGIVEKVKGNVVYTIEGNTSNMVARRSYSLDASKITGYGVVSSYLPASRPSTDGTVSSGSSEKKETTSSKKELKYLKEILGRKQKPMDNVHGKLERIKTIPDVTVRVVIQNGKKKFTIPVLDDAKLTYERCCVPGKFTFKTPADAKFKFREGNRVLFQVDGKDVFSGFVFTRSCGEDNIVSVTCYDQLRYLKNKTTMLYKNKTAAQLIRMIADDYKLCCGTVANTGYNIKKRLEDDATLFDIIQNALDLTLMSTGKMFVLYDHCGNLVLKDIAGMVTNSCVIDAQTGQSYQYTSTIDEDVYNQIKLVYENKESGSYDVYIARDSKNISKWGVLQYTEKIDTPDVGKRKANALLGYYNRKKRTLDVKGVFGSTSVRAGTLLPVLLALGDIKVQNYMMVEKVTHTFSNRQHTMDLSLSGGKFSG